TSPSVATSCVDAAAAQRLSTGRSHPGIALRADSWIAAHQQNSNPAIQWDIPLAVGFGTISRAIDSASISAPTAATDRPPIGAAARPAQRAVFGFAQDTQRPGLRLGLGGDHRLRTAAGCASGLQPKKERPTILPSIAVLRIAATRVLARIVPSWKYVGQYRRIVFHATLPEQSSPGTGSEPNSSKGRFGLLCGGAAWNAGKMGLWLCYGRQAVRNHPATRTSCGLQSIAPWLGNGRVLVSSAWLAQETALCRHPSPCSGRPGRTNSTHFVSRSALRLRSFGHQSAVDSLASLALLRAAGHCRKNHPRAALRFAAGPNSDRPLVGQRGLLPGDDAGVQFGALVQASLSIQGICQRDCRNGATRFPGRTRKTDTPSRPSRFAIASGLPVEEGVPAGCRETEAASNSKKLNL